MAYVTSSVVQSVHGNQRVVMGVIAADAASGAVDVGLSVITGGSVAPKSAATAAPLIKFNLNSAGTALNGSVFIKNAASGDDYHFVLFGR